MTDLKHLFLPYELSLIAEQKGFNDPCLAIYQIATKSFELIRTSHYDYVINSEVGSEYVCAPLYQQVTSWLRTLNVAVIQSPFGQWYVNELKNEVSVMRFSTPNINQAIEQAFKIIPDKK